MSAPRQEAARRTGDIAQLVLPLSVEKAFLAER